MGIHAATRVTAPQVQTLACSVSKAVTAEGTTKFGYRPGLDGDGPAAEARAFEEQDRRLIVGVAGLVDLWFRSL